MRRSPTIPKPVPCTICLASHPAINPTTRMIRRLSPDMCILVSLDPILRDSGIRECAGGKRGDDGDSLDACSSVTSAYACVAAKTVQNCSLRKVYCAWLPVG